MDRKQNERAHVHEDKCRPRLRWNKKEVAMYEGEEYVGDVTGDENMCALLLAKNDYKLAILLLEGSKYSEHFGRKLLLAKPLGTSVMARNRQMTFMEIFNQSNERDEKFPHLPNTPFVLRTANLVGAVVTMRRVRSKLPILIANDLLVEGHCNQRHIRQLMAKARNESLSLPGLTHK
ncbi:hypothetical protein P692DRAFT_201812307 [Suillus brevipes Sb2]|nr:hypothetical protein P692DRAFT_201812307 [Suillus brevipes Sb2]